MWGWNVTKNEAWTVLDQFVANGFYLVDTASNYPIDKKRENYGLAVDWLKQWVNSNPGILKVMVKIGSVNNSGSNSNNLTSSYLKNETCRLREALKDSLWGVAIHWDNREDIKNITETVIALNELNTQGLRIGLSGIKYPELYLRSGLLLDPHPYIEIKENFLYSRGRETYKCFAKNSHFWCYGINHAGYSINKNLDTFNVRDSRYTHQELERLDYIFRCTLVDSTLARFLNSSFDVCFYNALANHHVDGIILGIRNLEQLKNVSQILADPNCNEIATQVRSYISSLIHVNSMY